MKSITTENQHHCGTQETLALVWLLAAAITAVGFSLWQGLSLPLFTLLFLLLPLINLLTRRDAQRIGLGKIRWMQVLKWSGINLAALIVIYAVFEPWSGAYRFLLQEATGLNTSDPTFAWLTIFNGPAGWVGMFFFSGLVSIFAEELCFRGWLLRVLTPKVNPIWANVIQAALFTLPQLVVAFLMPRPVMGIVYGLVYAFGAIGLINGWVAHKAGAIWPNLIVATVMNLVLVIILL
jgi:membrane protease YdiL (CAAX protease family)